MNTTLQPRHPKVSVLTTVYKPSPEILSATIASVIRQTFADFEYLILDDCPDDDREELVKSFADPRIIYLKNERNLGNTRSRNRLLRLAKGEYMAPLGHDDVCRPDRLEKEVAYLDAHPECGVVSGAFNAIPHNRVFRNPERDSEIKRGLMSQCAIMDSASMLRMSVLREHDIGYDERFVVGEDLMMWLDLLPHTMFHNLPDVLIDYRIHESNVSKTKADEMQTLSRKILNIAQIRHPRLYAEAHLKDPVEKTIEFRLFGVTVLTRTVNADNDRSCYRLLGKLPLLKTRPQPMP